MVRKGQDGWQRRCRATVWILFRSMRDAEDRDPGEESRRPRRTREDGTQGFGKVCQSALVYFLPDISTLEFYATSSGPFGEG